MQSIISSIGQDNIYIIIAIIAIIIVALIIIIIIEKRSNNEYDNIKDFSYQTTRKKETKEKKNRKKENIKDIQVSDFDLSVNEESSEGKYTEVIATEVSKSSLPNTKEEAKQVIEQAARKMVYEEPDNFGPTYFEKEQEETSIISYDELMTSDVDINKENELLLEDEGNEPITIDELYKYQDENRIEIAVPTIEEKVTIDLKEEKKQEQTAFSGNKNFKSSDVISPVFGVKRDVIYKKEYNELGETINIEELEVEIKKTEEFLKELKKLKNKLE